jgi:hypothetical protein
MSEVSLIINTFSLILCILLSYKAYRSGNLIALIYWVVFIFLVVGQAIHISINLLDSTEVVYLYNVISREGHILASVFVLFIVAMMVILSQGFLITRKVDKNLLDMQRYNVALKNKHFGVYYLLNWVLFFLFSALLIQTVGGFEEWVSASRPMAPGSTFFIIALCSTTYPLLIKLASNLPLKLNDKLLFIVSILMILSVSRMIAVLYILILLFIYYYSTLYRGTKISLKRQRWAFVGTIFVIFIMFFGFGSYRHIAPQIGSTSPFEVFAYLVENPEASLFSLDLNYRVSVEGMTGFSGVLSESLDKNEIRADLGISALLGGLIQLIPSWFRGFLGDFPDYVRDLYHYQNSIVGGGLEGFFVHFSFFGIFIYPFVFVGLAYGIHRKMLSLQALRTDYGKRLLTLTIIAVYGLLIIRGSTTHLVFFIISNLVVMYLAIIFFKSFHTIRILKNENRH